MTWHIFSNKKLTSLVIDGIFMVLGLKIVSCSETKWWILKFVNVTDVELAIEVTAVGRIVAWTWNVKMDPLFFSDLQ
jgi:hypothetical protein